jgi:hypothetical protein
MNIVKELIAVAVLCQCCLGAATPIPEFDIKMVLALPQDAQAVMYESLTKQWEDSTDEEKEAFRLSMRKQLEPLSFGEKLSVISQIFSAVSKAKTGSNKNQN